MAITPYEILTNHPAHLFVGNPHTLNTQIISLLQKRLCNQDGCTYCGVCQGIYNRTYHQLMWLEPEGNYTRELIQPIFNTLALQQNSAEPFFIVITHAERLQPSTANALLKSLEEPPEGYHFILTTTQPRLVIKTIASRCIIHDNTPHGTTTVEENKLIAHFTGSVYHNPITFLTLLDHMNLSDQESYDHLDTILSILRIQLEKTLTSQPQKAADQLPLLIDIFVQTSMLPPQSGSSKIFWKNLYLKTNAYYIHT